MKRLEGNICQQHDQQEPNSQNIQKLRKLNIKKNNNSIKKLAEDPKLTFLQIRQTDWPTGPQKDAQYC